jgi:two-component system phosphate regulon sensor histidine kinase PhoR
VTFGVRGKLFVGALAIFAFVEVGSGVVIEHRLRQGLERRIEAELRREARMGCELLMEEPSPSRTRDPEAMKAVADRLARSGEARITIVAADGRVIGDSGMTVDEARTAENHATRPEVHAATAHGLGTSRRYSRTVGASLLYVAVACGHGPDRQIVRVATSLEHVDALVGEQRAMLVSVGVIAFLTAGLAGWIASRLALRRLRQMVIDTRAAASAGGARRVEVSTRDEVGRLAGSFNRLAEELDSTVRRLADERDRLETILESMDEAVVALDRDGRVTLVNAAAIDLLDAAEKDPAGWHLLEVVRAPALAELVDRAQRTEHATAAELDLPGPQRRRVEAHVAPLGSASGVVIVMVDVTEVRRLETIRRDFVANVSHELRTPVSVIRANAETLLDGALDDPDQAARFVEATHRNAERLSKLVGDLLDLSRIEAGRLDLELGPAPVAVAVGRVFELLERAARAKEIALVSEVSRELIAWADETALDHVLLDLLDNAVKYTPRGGRVEVRAALQGDRIDVVVQDDGPGIAPRHRDRVFERFYRVDKGRSREMGGTGLGLSIASHLVEAMGGEIGMRPASPHGSEFWFAVPAAPRPPGE